MQCPPAFLALLKEHRRLQAAERLKAGDRWEDNDLVFATRLGGPIERTEDWKVWKSILRQAKVRDARVHDARHTAATLLIEQGVHIRVAQEVLGHTDRALPPRGILQMKDASDTPGLRPLGRLTATQTATLSRFRQQKGPLPELGRGPLNCGGSGI
ncbi:tyrosine-type recombinase/integrase [Herbidospora yilanensis]|uniref:tyrosine-type recombinase/integrase n=1 Tax=Herbidospora yilanensis TaxID=354426 RepID=UPI0018DC11AA